jgi:hypothetical protein
MSSIANSSCSGSSFSERRPNYALQLPQEVALPIHLRQRMVARGDRSVALCDRSVALRARRCHQRLRRVDIDRKLICDVVHINHSI